MLIAHNTLVNDGVTGRSGDLPPQGVTFANNILRKSSGTHVSEGANWSDIKYEGNILFGGAAAGSLPASGYRVVDPQLTRDARGLWKLAEGSPAVNSAVGAYGVSHDIEGQPRSAPDVGADELSTEPALHRPLTREDVGPNATAGPVTPPPDGGMPPVDAWAGMDGAVPDAGGELDVGAGGAGGSAGGGSGGRGGDSGAGGTSSAGSGGSGSGAGGSGVSGGGRTGDGRRTGGAGGTAPGGGEPSPGGCGCRLDAGAGTTRSPTGLAIVTLLALALLSIRRRKVRRSREVPCVDRKHRAQS
jgi:hypothetical protein